MNRWEQKIEIRGRFCYTVPTFAALTNHSDQSIRDLMHKGNYIRKIEFIYFVDKPFIPIEELVNFPFTTMGRPKKDGSKSTYHFTENGEVKQ